MAFEFLNIQNLKSYPVMEQFYTVQGEGFYSGRAAYFIRIGGCDVGCSWCDVKESWDASLHPVTTVEELVENVKLAGSNFCVITGGEPTLYNLQALTESLQANNIETAIETSGAYPISGFWHWVCLSPKKFKEPLLENYRLANELKVIVSNKHDFIWAEEKSSNVNETCLLYLQPEWNKEKEMLPLIIDFIKKYPKWKVSLQTHKYMNIP